MLVLLQRRYRNGFDDRLDLVLKGENATVDRTILEHFICVACVHINVVVYLSVGLVSNDSERLYKSGV